MKRFFKFLAGNIYAILILLCLGAGIVTKDFVWFMFALYFCLRDDYIKLQRRMDAVEDDNDRVNRQLVDTIKKTLGDK